MTVPAKATPREFGEALRRAREAAAVPLEAISARTKIGVRLLTAIEDGEFGQLPNHTFARIFLRQYLEMIGEPHEEWLVAFEAAWRHFADSSQPSLPVGPPIRARRRRVGPWAVGLAVVAVAGAAVFLVESRRVAGPPASAILTPVPEPAGRAEPSPGVPATAPTAAAVAASQAPATTLVVSALRGPCWVEVTVAGEPATSRLLAAGAAWQVPAAGRAIDLVLGDAGAASVSYMGDVRDPAGKPGQVVRLHLAGNQPSAVTP